LVYQPYARLAAVPDVSSGESMGSGTLRRKAYNYIHAKILSGDLPDGEQVSELSLAKQIGISRTPVREAVQQLRREGLVEQLPRLGTIVRTPQRRDILELYEVREALEPFAVGLAARRVRPVEFPALDTLCAEMDRIGEELKDSGLKTLDTSRLKRFLTADLGFHMMLIRAGGNQRIMRIVADSRVLTRLFSSRRQEHDHSIIRETYQFHSQILDAVKSGDSEAATRLTTDHIRTSKRETLEFYDHVHAEAGVARPLGLPEHLLAELDRVTSDIDIDVDVDES
jgi:DNA-binding GntR family transcriptional regulator